MIDVSRVVPTREALAAYAGVSSQFVVTAYAVPEALENGEVALLSVETPYMKDAGNEDPRDWPSRYDLSRWAIFSATDDGRVAGACAVARDAASRYFDSSSRDALLWDIRVSPEARGRGAGKALIRAAAAWALSEGCSTLLIETQHTNVAACALYLAAGCTVRSLLSGAYEEWPDDILLLWQLALA